MLNNKLKNKDLKPRLLYLARLSFKIEGEIQSFPDKKKLKEFITTSPVVQEIVKGLCKKKEKRKGEGHSYKE